MLLTFIWWALFSMLLKETVTVHATLNYEIIHTQVSLLNNN